MLRHKKFYLRFIKEIMFNHDSRVLSLKIGLHGVPKCVECTELTNCTCVLVIRIADSVNNMKMEIVMVGGRKDQLFTYCVTSSTCCWYLHLSRISHCSQ